MNTLFRILFVSILVLGVFALALGTFQPALAAGAWAGPPAGNGKGVEPPYGPPGFAGGGCAGQCFPGWDGSTGNQGPH